MRNRVRLVVFVAAVFLVSMGVVTALPLSAQAPKAAYTPAEQVVVDQLKTLRSVPEEQRGQHIKDLALQIRALPAGMHKVQLGAGLASLSTEGDFGHDMLQAVATTLGDALAETPVPAEKDQPAYPYAELAQLVRYEHLATTLKDPQLSRAEAQLVREEADVQKATFTLSDVSGKSWTLSDLRGKVVLVNFWATWCPPCRLEMPDLDAFSKRFASQGLVVLSITDEDAAKVNPYLAAHKITYPILLDPGRKVAERFHVQGIPRTFVFDRNGKLVTQAIDRRTKNQFLQMLAQAGLQDTASLY